MEMPQELLERSQMAQRFRGFLPVVVDVETGGFDSRKDALLEIAAVILEMDSQGNLQIKESYSKNIEPFPGANIDEAALEFTGIDLYDPERMMEDEGEGEEQEIVGDEGQEEMDQQQVHQDALNLG